MPGGMATSPEQGFHIRSFRTGDLPACRKLYREGLIGGTLAENDTGFDLDDIESVYMKRAGNHFWVAVAPPDDAPQGSAGDPESWPVVGMIGVQHHDADVGEIRRLRVAQTHRRRGIGSGLIEAALKFCQERQYLKITLDTFMEREPAIKLFEKFRFHHNRTRKVGGKELMYFYLDLYVGEERNRQHG
jgi:ribosomal protein S18 acetylase RimI-like enzyme